MIPKQLDLEASPQVAHGRSRAWDLLLQRGYLLQEDVLIADPPEGPARLPYDTEGGRDASLVDHRAGDGQHRAQPPRGDAPVVHGVGIGVTDSWDRTEQYPDLGAERLIKLFHVRNVTS